MSESADDGAGDDFASVLAALIEGADMTVPEVARAASLNDQTIRNYLAGSRSPRLDGVRKLEGALPDIDQRMRQSLGLPLRYAEHAPTAPDALDEMTMSQLIKSLLDKIEMMDEKIELLSQRLERGAPAPSDQGGREGSPT